MEQSNNLSMDFKLVNSTVIDIYLCNWQLLLQFFAEHLNLIVAIASWLDKVTTVTWSFVSVIEIVHAPVTGEITQFAHQVRIKLVSQLSSLLRALQKLLKYFNCNASSKSLVPEALVEFFKFEFEFKWFRICHVILWIISVTWP